MAGAVQNASVLDVTNPQTIYISASNINALYAEANIDSYVQLNINNNSAGTAASSDIVATADNGTETSEFIDMGINSSGYSSTGVIGGPNDGYLYITSSLGELHLGNAGTTANSNVRIFAGSGNSDASTRLFVSSSGRIGVGVSSSLNAQLQVQGNVSASSYTSSVANAVGFLGTASRAVSASYTDTFSGFINFPQGLVVTGSLIVSGSGIQLTGSQLFGTASYALNAGTATGGGFPFSGSAVITGSLTITGSGITGSNVTAIPEMTMLVSGTIAAPGGTTVRLNLTNHNYFNVSASSTGTVTWVIVNPPPTGEAQSIVVEYINGGVVTNSWFTGIKWPGGTAPTLTSGANPDILGFVTDDGGTNWRGVLLQRNSS